METGYYSKKTIEDFIKKNLCQDDKLLYKYYQEVNIHKFRRLCEICWDRANENQI